MDQSSLIAALADRIGQVDGLTALFLAGSFGNGTADDWSDVDLVALAPPDRFADIVAAMRATLEHSAPVILWKTIGPGPALVNAITADWQRVDLTLSPPDGLGRRERGSLKPLVDPGDLLSTLPEALPPRAPDPKRVEGLIVEFIRVLGLTPVVVGRGELVVSAAGAGMQRGFLQQLMMERVTLPDPGGALHLGRLLSADDMAVLAGLPYPRPVRSELLNAYLANAQAFMPRARALASELGVAWPKEFEAATRAHLITKLPEIDWRW